MEAEQQMNKLEKTNQILFTNPRSTAGLVIGGEIKYRKRFTLLDLEGCFYCPPLVVVGGGGGVVVIMFVVIVMSLQGYV